jgi:hypothetical protein
LWKDLAYFKGNFPIYQGDIRRGKIFQSLGPHELHKKLN